MAKRRKEVEVDIDVDDDDFDLDAAMESGAVVQDARGGGFNASFDGAFISKTRTLEEALVHILEESEYRGYYPDIFYVNDHGNVDLLSVEGRTRKAQIVGASYKIVRSWV